MFAARTQEEAAIVTSLVEQLEDKSLHYKCVSGRRLTIEDMPSSERSERTLVMICGPPGFNAYLVGDNWKSSDYQALKNASSRVPSQIEKEIRNGLLEGLSTRHVYIMIDSPDLYNPALMS